MWRKEKGDFWAAPPAKSLINLGRCHSQTSLAEELLESWRRADPTQHRHPKVPSAQPRDEGAQVRVIFC